MNNRFVTMSIVMLIILSCIGWGFAFIFLNNQTSLIEEEPEEMVTLTFWRNYGNAGENKAYEELIKTFEKSYPHIQINMNSIQYGDYELRLRTEIAAGSPPDIMSIDSPNLALYAHRESLISLDTYMSEDGVIYDIPKEMLEGVSYRGKVYLAPVVAPSTALFYNKHLFKKAGLPIPSKDPNEPMSWDQVLEAAKKITDLEEGVIGIDPAQGFAGGESPAYFKLPILWQFGGEVLSPDNTTASGYLNSEDSIKALEFYQRLYHTEKVAAIEMPKEAFETGKLGMTVLGSWALGNLESAYPNFKLGEDYGIAPLPKGKYQVVPTGSWSLGISSASEHPSEAWEFIEFLTSYEGMKTYVDITGDIPARQSVAKAFPEFNEYPKNIFVEQSRLFSKNRPVTPAYPVVSSALKTLFEDIGIGNKDVKESADKAVRTINTGINDLDDQ